MEGPHKGILHKILLKTPCPVVVLKYYRPVRHVLFVADGEEASRRAASGACRLFKGLPVSLHFIHSAGGAGESFSAQASKSSREKLEAAGLEVCTHEVQGTTDPRTSPGGTELRSRPSGG